MVGRTLKEVLDTLPAEKRKAIKARTRELIAEESRRKLSVKDLVEAEVHKRAHLVEGYGDGIFMVFIRLDEIVAIVKKMHRRHKRKNGV